MKNTEINCWKACNSFPGRKGQEDGSWKKFSENILYFEKDLLDDNTYSNIIGWINDKAREWNAKPTVIFYLAVAPQLAPGISQKLADQKICTDPKSTRIVFEKAIWS
jgi:glucose-6-phosphate 1-dehydrogenase